MHREERKCGCGLMVDIEWPDDANPTVWHEGEKHLCEHVAGFKLPLPRRDPVLDNARGGGFLPKK
jgi:hypothetical protein